MKEIKQKMEEILGNIPAYQQSNSTANLLRLSPGKTYTIAKEQYKSTPNHNTIK
jgi:hypothetical protein